MSTEFAALELAGRLVLATSMAVFLGLAFEGIYKLDQESSPGGIRTFPLLTILGALLALLEPKTLLPFVIGFGAVAAWLYAHIQMTPTGTQRRPSLMIPGTNALAYTLGPIALTQPPWLTVAVSVTAVILLESRQALHRLVHRVAPDEVFTLGKFLILVGVILPLLPNRPLIAWTLITPFQVWLALVVVSTLSYVSYLLQKYLPAHLNAWIPAILGGLYSSTVTTVALARQQRAANAPRGDASAGIIIATAIMYVRLAAVIALFNWSLATALLPALAALSIMGAGLAVWDWNRAAPAGATRLSQVGATNPLQLATALGFAILFVVIAVASNWVRSSFGERGIFILAAVTGTTDIDPFVINLAQGGVASMSLNTQAAAILIAASSNNALKAAYALVFGGAHPCWRAAAGLLVLALAGLITAALYVH